MSARAEIKDVKQWAYMRMLSGKEVNTLHLITMFDREQKRRSEQLFSNLLHVSQQIAVSSAIMTKHKRTKYRDKMMRVGLKSYYLFHRHYVPADIFPLLDDFRDDKCIYGREDD